MRITQLFVNRPTLVFVFLVLVLIVGGVSYATLVNQQFPNIDFPTISVRLSYPGGSTTEIRDAIVRPIEDAIAGAPNLDHLTTTIQNGQASISATFTLNSNKTTDLVEVQRRVESAEGNLPSDLTAPTVASFDASEPTVATLVVTSQSLTPAALSALVTNNIIPALEQAPGIANVGANGSVTPAIEVDVNPNKLEASGLTLADLVSAISSNNVRAPGGYAYEANRETSVDVRGDITDASSVANLFLAATAGGTGAAAPSAPSGEAPVNQALPSAPTGSLVSTSTSDYNQWSVAARYLRVGDVASVVDAYETRRSYSYVNGLNSMTLSAQKTTGASEVAASNGVLSALPALREEYPAVTFTVLNVQSTYTREQIDSVWHTLAEGILFTGLVMLFFLRSWRNAAVVLVAIPTSLLVTFAVMKAANFTIDTVSLLAMTLLIGILVDDSIVILENIGRHFESGEAPRTAAILGRAEIGPAAVVITLVDVVVFLPIAFLPGITGRFLSEFALVVVTATLTSLAVSFTVTPALAGNWSMRSNWRPWKIIDRFGHGFERTRELYATRILPWALARPFLIFAASAALTVGAFFLLYSGAIGEEFMPSVDRGQIFVGVTYPTGTPLSTTNAAIAAISREIANESPDIQSVTSTAGSERQGFGGQINIGSAGQIQVNLALKPKHSSDWWAQELGVQARKIAPYPATVVAIPATGSGGGNSQPIDELVESADDEPEKYAAAILQALEQTPGAVHATSSAASLAPQVDVVFDRERARALDANIATAANAIRATYGGDQATQFDTSNGIKYVQVTYPQSAQQSVRGILEIPMRSNSGNVLHVGDFASLVEDPTSPLMTRTNRQTVVHVSANVAPGASLSSVQSAFMQRLRTLHLPSGVTVTPTAGGQQQNFGQAIGGIAASLVLSSFFVYILMVALYDSYRLPFVIMFAVPVAAVGALGSLWITGQTLNLFSMIGTVLLVGLVSKNGILLVDFANHRVRAGADRASAIRESARERFRPIVMTTMSMIAGMTPVALALDPGGASRQALGVVVIGGLTSSLLLTLVLVPCAFVKFAPTYSDLQRKATPQRRSEPRPSVGITV